jgi:peptidoglycan-associated lipoprotein
MNQNLKKSLTTVMVALVFASVVSGCSWFRKKGENSGDATNIRSETTADGSSETLDNSPINLGATGSDSGSIEGLKTVFFPYDSSSLSEGESQKLMANIEWMKKNSKSRLTIEGHCDQRGSAEYNLALGERRANAVRQVFIANGIQANRVTTVSFGKEKLLAQGDSDEAMAKNRRANFVPVQ